MTIPSTIRNLFDPATRSAGSDALTGPREHARDAYPIARLPVLANAASNLATDLDTHLPDRLSSTDHATVARLIAAKAMQEAAAYAWLAHTLATEAHDWPAIVQRIEALVCIEHDKEALKRELLRHRLERLRQAMSAQYGRRSPS